MKKLFYFLVFTLIFMHSNGQESSIYGKVKDSYGYVRDAKITLLETELITTTSSLGDYEFRKLSKGTYTLFIETSIHQNFEKKIYINGSERLEFNIFLNDQTEILDEVVITAVSKVTLKRESPLSSMLISSKQIETGTESNIMDILVSKTPGLNAVKTGPNISKPFIRGLGYNRVLTLYDGIRQEGQQWGDEHGLEIDDYNISRAEIIKGPSSLIYGSDALAGVVSLFSSIPNEKEEGIHGNTVNEYHTNNGLIGNGFRLGYNNENWIFALRSSYRMAKNYKNPIDGWVYLTNYKVTNFSTLIGYKTRKGYTHINFTLYDNMQGIPDGSRDSISRKFTKQIFEDDLDDDDNRPIVPNNELNSYKIPTLSQHIQHYRIFAHNFYKINKGDIDFTIGLQQNIRREYNHPTQPKQAGMYVKLNTTNYSLRYNAPTIFNIEISFGINGMAQKNNNLDATDFPIPDYKLLDFGPYLYAKWKNDKWTVSGGLRYDLRSEKWDDFYVGVNPETGFEWQSNSNDPDADLPFPAFSKTFKDWSASLGTTYKLSSKLSLKANLGRTFRAPNITELASNGLDPGAHIIHIGDRTFNSEISFQQDLGMMASFKDFSTEISIFNNYIENYIYLNAVIDENGNPLVDAQGNKTYKYQQTNSKLYGGEIWFAIHPRNIPQLRMDNNLSVVYALNQDKAFKGKGIDGEYLPLIPPLQIKSDLLFDFHLNKTWFQTITPNFGMEYSAKQNRYFGLNETESPTPSYTLFNLGLSAEFNYFKTKKIQFLIHVNNLFDTAYQSHLSRLKYLEDYENGNGIYNMGRNIAFKLIVSL